MRTKIHKILSILLVIVMTLTILPTYPIFASVDDNIGSGDAAGSTGTGNSSWKYTPNNTGVRITLYWAEGSLPSGSQESIDKAEKEAFNNGAIRLGVTTHFIPSGINSNYNPEVDSAKSIFDYLNRNEVYKVILKGQSGFFPYYTSKEVVVKSMPDPIKGDAEDWKRWIKGNDLDNPSYANIPAITKLLGYQVSAKDFKEGIFTEQRTGEKKVGQYKLFIEPEMAVYIDGVCSYVTLRDMIAMSEHKKYPSLEKLVNNLNLVFEYLANPMYLIANEDVIELKSNTWNGAKWDKQGKPYHIDYDSNNKTSSRAAMVKALSKGGQAYESMGVGVFSPQKDMALSGKSYKVMKSYVQPIINTNGEIEYSQVYAETEMSIGDFLSKLGLGIKSTKTIEEYITDRVVSTEYGLAYLNDIITSPKELDIKSFNWASVLPVDKKDSIKPTEEDIWSYNVGITTRIFLLCDELIKSKEFSDFETITQMYADRQNQLKSAKGAEKEAIIADMEELMKEVMIWLDLDTSHEIHDNLGRIKKGQALLIERALNVKNADRFVKNATYISDPRTIVMEDSMKGNEGVLYLRYFLDPTPLQINVIHTYKDGKLVDKQVVNTVPDSRTAKTQAGDMLINITKFTDMREEGYPDAELVKLVTVKKPGSLTEMPSNTIKSQKTLQPLNGLELGEIIFVEWKIDAGVTKVSSGVQQWRLSLYKNTMGYNQKASMSMSLKNDAGHKAAQSYISPSGSYSYTTINPNGKETVSKNTVENMKYSDWLHTKSITKGSYTVTHDNPNVAVDITGNYNAIKSSALSGLKLANWVNSTSAKKELANYDISSGTKSAVEKTKQTKTTTLDFGIKNKSAYAHQYGVYKHHTETRYYTTLESYTFKDKDGNDRTGYYYDYHYYDVDICDCHLATETLKPNYTLAQYKLTVDFNDYKAKNNDKNALTVKATKIEDNGKTTISKQNTKSLLVYPEIPMLFQDNTGKESLVFAAGTEDRKISLVDYHTLEYTAYVKDPKVIAGSTSMDSKAKTKAKQMGLGSSPVALKGSTLSNTFEVKKSNSSNENGILTVKSYALDINDNSLKSSWGNSSYNPKDAHDTLLSDFNRFRQGKATQNLDISVPGGTNSAYSGPNVVDNISYKELNTRTVNHTLTIRGGVLTHINGKTLSSVKSSNPELYKALEGMKLIGKDKDATVLKTFESGVGDRLTESTFASLSNAARNGVNDIVVGKGWYFEDSTVLVVREYITTYELPISMFSDKIPMSIKGLETPANKAQFYNKMSLGYTVLNYTMTSKNLGSGLGQVKVYFEHNSRTGSPYGSNKASYGVGNVSITDSTFGGGF